MKKYAYILAAIAVIGAPALASAQAVTIQTGNDRGEVRRDGGNVRVNEDRSNREFGGERREGGNWDRRERSGVRVELNGDRDRGYERRSWRQSRAQRIVVIKHRSHRRHHHEM